MQRGPGARGGSGGHIIAGGGGPVGAAVHLPILRIPFLYHLPPSIQRGRERGRGRGKKEPVEGRGEEESGKEGGGRGPTQHSLPLIRLLRSPGHAAKTHAGRLSGKGWTHGHGKVSRKEETMWRRHPTTIMRQRKKDSAQRRMY